MYFKIISSFLTFSHLSFRVSRFVRPFGASPRLARSEARQLACGLLRWTRFKEPVPRAKNLHPTPAVLLKTLPSRCFLGCAQFKKEKKKGPWEGPVHRGVRGRADAADGTVPCLPAVRTGRTGSQVTFVLDPEGVDSASHNARKVIFKSVSRYDRQEPAHRRGFRVSEIKDFYP